MPALKRSVASLVGGVAIGAFIFALWLLLAGTSPEMVIAGLAVGAGIGAWVRLADL